MCHVHEWDHMIFGVVSNGNCQNWQVACCCDGDPSRSRVRSFVVIGGDFPLDEMLAAYAGYDIHELPDELRETLSKNTDFCWQLNNKYLW